jgi:hypothetical protein
MIGLGTPEVFRHSGQQTLCLSPSPFAYASLFRYAGGRGGDTFYGLDVWAADGRDTVYCAGRSDPLKPSEQTDSDGGGGGGSTAAPPPQAYAVQWRRDGSRLCALACSNVYLLDTNGCVGSGSGAGPVSDAAASPAERSGHAAPGEAHSGNTNPAKLRSIGGIFIPGTIAMGSTDDYIFFCHEDGLILQYGWDMAFLGVISLAPASRPLAAWPPQKLSFDVQSDRVHVHHDAKGEAIPGQEQGQGQGHGQGQGQGQGQQSDFFFSSVKPISSVWNNVNAGWPGGGGRDTVGCALCTDGSICFLLARRPVAAGRGGEGEGEGAGEAGPCLSSMRYTLSDSGRCGTTRRILHAQFVACPPQGDGSESLAALGDAGRPGSAAHASDVCVACLVAESAAHTSSRLELVILLLSPNHGERDGEQPDPRAFFDSAILSIVSTTLLCADCPVQHCLDRGWSSLDYPYAMGSAAAYPAGPAPAGTLSGIDLLKQRLCVSNPGRSDELLVTLGSRVFCIKLDFRGNDEKVWSGPVHAVATIKFSIDCSMYVHSLSKRKAVSGKILCYIFLFVIHD